MCPPPSCLLVTSVAFALAGCGRSELFALGGPPVELDADAISTIDVNVPPEPEAGPDACVCDAASPCTTGDTRCVGDDAEACVAGEWGPARSCAPGLCQNGSCVPSPPSCLTGGDGRSNCGGDAESCCISLAIQGGTFYRTYTNDGSGPTGEADPATVSSFRLDKYDVTVGRFRAFVDAVLPADGGAGWEPAAGSGKHVHLNGGKGLVFAGLPPDAGTVYEAGWMSYYGPPEPTAANLGVSPDYGDYTWTVAPGPNEQRPIVFANWQLAYAFCIWDGGFLPSGAEWEYAAAGGDEQREYPWGSTDPGGDNQYAIYNCDYPTGLFADSGVCGTNVTFMSPVGTATAGAGRWGQLDLTSNVYVYMVDYYAPYVGPCVDCMLVGGGVGQAVLGNDYVGPQFALVPPRNSLGDGPTSGGAVGFRCARPP